MSHNMVNFVLLAAEIVSGVWGTAVTFNGFRVLAALLRGSQVVSISQTLRIEQRVPPMFGRATIRLGIGPHSSSSSFFFLLSFFPRLISAVGDWMFTIPWHMVWP